MYRKDGMELALYSVSRSDNDGEIDSDIEDAIFAQLYFQDSVKSKKSGVYIHVLAQCL